MKAIKTLKITTLALMLVPAMTTVAAEGKWQTISGTMDGWRIVAAGNNAAPNWHLENGEFVADSGNGHLVTRETYGDFHLKAEFYAADGKSNSGIYFHIENADKIADDTAYEANIIDERPDQTGRTGGIPHYGPPSQIVNAGGKWNTYDITVQGDHIVLIINGIKTVDIHDSTHKNPGPISLQYAAGVIKFRNVQIMKL